MSSIEKTNPNPMNKEDSTGGLENEDFFETITIEKSKNGQRIKFMNFTVKASEKSDLTKMVMDLLIRISEKKGYTQYYNSKTIDPFASEKVITEDE